VPGRSASKGAMVRVDEAGQTTGHVDPFVT